MPTPHWVSGAAQVCARRGRGSRLALYLDLENLLYDRRQAQDWDGAVLALAALVHGFESRGTLVARIAYGDPGLVRQVGFQLTDLGIRSRISAGGENGADLALLGALDHELPNSCDTVIIGSGDHLFAPVARRLRAQGRRVEVVACAGTVSADLYASADAFTPFQSVEDELASLDVDARSAASGSSA